MLHISPVITMKHKDIKMNTTSIKKMHTIGIVWGIVFIIVLAGLTIIGFVYKSRVIPYKELEQKLKDTAVQYVEKKVGYSGSDMKVTVEELVKEGFIEELKVNDGSCEGYIVLKKVQEHYEQNSYIKCEKYKTKGYDKNA